MESSNVLPTIPAMLELQGIPRHITSSERTLRMADDAIALFKGLAEPVALMMEIDFEQFATVFEGEHLNDSETPVRPIAQAADHLALFAVTIGQPLCDRIGRLFADQEPALATMLDAAASEGAENLAAALEVRLRDRLRSSGVIDRRGGTLRFSPGYCGWHVSGQKKLFGALQPGSIGITLNESYLMQPLKSISGVLIAGRKEIFAFDDTYSFCRDCADHSCRDRLVALSDQ